MPKLNAVLMVLLAAATIAIAGFLAFEGSGPTAAAETARMENLLRKFSDHDPDLHREAEAELRALGPRAAGVLREASRSSDPTLASRAAKLLRDLEPPVAAAVKVERLPGPPAPAPDGPLQFRIECPETELRDGEPTRLYVRFVNQGLEPVILSRGLGARYSTFAHFEVTDPTGHVFRLPTESDPGAVRGIDLVKILAGKTLDLYAGREDGRTAILISGGQPGAYRVRFVWDAREGSVYRKSCDPFCAGPPLPAQFHSSNEIILHLTD